MYRKFDLEFLFEKMKVGNYNTQVFIMKIKGYTSLDKENFMPIRSYYCKKVCRLVLFIIKLKRLLKKVRERKSKTHLKNKRTKRRKKRKTTNTGFPRLDSLIEMDNVTNKQGEPINFAEILATGVIKANIFN